MPKVNRGWSTVTIDAHVGARIRQRRIALSLSQRHIAELIGITSQQWNKYECGINRVSAARLYQIARVLNASIAYFYEGVSQQTPQQAPAHQDRLLEMTRHFLKIRNGKYKKAVSDLARALAGR